MKFKLLHLQVFSLIIMVNMLDNYVTLVVSKITSRILNYYDIDDV